MPKTATKPKTTKTVKTDDKDAPPLRIDSTIQLAWGMTMNFSHEGTQKEVGKDFRDWLKTLRENHKEDKYAQVYIDNLSAVLSSYLRTSAFEREVYVGYLDTYKNLRETNTKNINDIADLASFSSGSLLTKIAAFLGFGSLAEIIGAITHLASPTQGLPFNLNYVLFGGLLGLAATVFAFRLARGSLIHRAEKHSYKKQLLLWRDKAKPCFTKELLFLLERLESLVRALYPSYSEEILDWDKGQLAKYLEDRTTIKKDNQLGKYFEGMLPDKDLYKITKKQRGWLQKRLFSAISRIKAHLHPEKKKREG